MGYWEELDSEKKQKLSKALRNVDLLARLTPEQLNTLLDESQIRDFESGEIILLKGEISESLYIIGSGKAVICLKEPKQLGGSDYFGEMSLFLKRPVTCSVKGGDGGVRILALPGKLLKEMVDSNPSAKKVVNDKMQVRGVPGKKKDKK